VIERSRTARTLVGVVLLLAGLASTASAQPVEAQIIRLSLEGVVDPFVSDYLRNGIEGANEAAAVLLTIDTPGGLDSSMREIIKAIEASRTPVVCYVTPEGARAASAGAFILMACQVAAMAPATNVGASTPVGIGGVTLSKKIEEDAAATISALAEQRGRNVDLASSFVTESKSITAQEALAGDVIEFLANSERELLTRVDGMRVRVADGTAVTLRTAGATIQDRSMSAGVGFLHQLFDPNLAFIFFWLGLALIVLELIVPGHVFSGTVGTILLLLSIVSFGLLPVRLIGIALLVASVVFFVVELKVPGLGISSVAGIVSLVLGGLFLFDTAGGVRVSPFAIVPMAAFMGLFFGFVVSKALTMRNLPPAQGAEAVVGREGVVLPGGLDPDGVVRVAAEEWRARSAGGSIPEGSKIRVTRLDGLVLTVEPLAPEHAPTGGAVPARGGNT
jgi:membrane-bound serine protease (ClpP class)